MGAATPGVTQATGVTPPMLRVPQHTPTARRSTLGCRIPLVLALDPPPAAFPVRKQKVYSKRSRIGVRYILCVSYPHHTTNPGGDA